MQILLLLLTILGGMGLSVEAGLLGPLGKEVGELWATFGIFGVGAALTFTHVVLAHAIALHFYTSILAITRWRFRSGLRHYFDHYYSIIGIAMTMIGILTGQVSKSLIIDHYGLLGTPHRKVDRKRVVALIFIVVALVLVSKA